MRTPCFVSFARYLPRASVREPVLANPHLRLRTFHCGACDHLGEVDHMISRRGFPVEPALEVCIHSVKNGSPGNARPYPHPFKRGFPGSKPLREMRGKLLLVLAQNMYRERLSGFDRRLNRPPLFTAMLISGGSNAACCTHDARKPVPFSPFPAVTMKTPPGICPSALPIVVFSVPIARLPITLTVRCEFVPPNACAAERRLSYRLSSLRRQTVLLLPNAAGCGKVHRADADLRLGG